MGFEVVVNVCMIIHVRLTPATTTTTNFATQKQLHIFVETNKVTKISTLFCAWPQNKDGRQSG